MQSIRPYYIEHKLDKIFLQHGHTVLRLPPYHPDLNPIENVWGVLKRRVAAENIKQSDAFVKELIKKHFENESRDLWKDTCEKIRRTELSYLCRDFHIELCDEYETFTYEEFDILSNEEEITEDEVIIEPHFGTIDSVPHLPSNTKASYLHEPEAPEPEPEAQVFQVYGEQMMDRWEREAQEERDFVDEDGKKTNVSFI